jgi:hypothetical protein
LKSWSIINQECSQHHMSYRSSYRILPELRLVVTRYSGKISEKEIIATKEAVRNDEAFRMEYNILDDFSGTDFNITRESFSNVLTWLKDHFSWERKSAVIANTPSQVANILRFDSLNRDTLPMNIKIFSTFQAALQWIGIDKNENPQIDAILQLLQKEG